MSETYKDSCQDKVSYLDRRDARRARRRVNHEGHLNIYRCAFCRLFHLGHLPPLVRAGRWDKDEWKAGKPPVLTEGRSQ